MLGSTGLQGVGHNIVSEQQQHKREESEKHTYIYTDMYHSAAHLKLTHHTVIRTAIVN